MRLSILLSAILVVLSGCEGPTEPLSPDTSPAMKSQPAQSGYEIIDLGGWDYMSTRSINNRGQIVGWGSSPTFDDHAFLWDGDQLVDLFVLSGWFGQPFDINERGQAVGLSFDTWKAVLWDDGTLLDLVGLQSAEGINNRGQIAGRADGVPYRAAVWEEGQIRSLGSLGGWGSHAFDINNGGAVVGFSDVAGGCVPEPGWYGCTADHAFMWKEGQPLVDLGTLGGLHSYASAINEAGRVVGRSSIDEDRAYPYHAFLWRDGQIEDLGTLGGEYSYGYGINNRGQIVGWSATSSGESHAFLWYRGHMVDLGCLPGGDFCEAFAINDRGQIAGTSDDASGEVRLVMWTR